MSPIKTSRSGLWWKAWREDSCRWASGRTEEKAVENLIDLEARMKR